MVILNTNPTVSNSLAVVNIVGLILYILCLVLASSEIAAEFTVNFICEGCQYSIEGQKEITASNLYNDGYITHPIYKVEGEGECTLTVNGKAVKANVGQNLTIDTDRMIAYRTDGTMQNTSLTGDYEDLYLIEGENKVSITSGFVLKIIPNWRYL